MEMNGIGKRRFHGPDEFVDGCWGFFKIFGLFVLAVAICAALLSWIF